METQTKMAPNQLGETATLAVTVDGDTIYRVFAGATWDSGGSSSPNGQHHDRHIELTNLSDTDDLYGCLVPWADPNDPTMDSDNWNYIVDPRATKTIFVPRGYDLAVTRASGSTGQGASAIEWGLK